MFVFVGAGVVLGSSFFFYFFLPPKREPPCLTLGYYVGDELLTLQRAPITTSFCYIQKHTVTVELSSKLLRHPLTPTAYNRTSVTQQQQTAIFITSTPIHKHAESVFASFGEVLLSHCGESAHGILSEGFFLCRSTFPT